MAEIKTIRGSVQFCFFAPNSAIVEVIKTQLVETCPILDAYLKDSTIVLHGDDLVKFIQSPCRTRVPHPADGALNTQDRDDQCQQSIAGIPESREIKEWFLIIIGERYERLYNDMVTSNYNIHNFLSTVRVHSFALRSFPTSDVKMMRLVDTRDQQEVRQTCQEVATDWTRMLATLRRIEALKSHQK